MQFFISIDGKKEGPLSLYHVVELLRDGNVSPGALGWHQGLKKWSPLLEIPALKSTIEEIKAGPPELGADKGAEEAEAAVDEIVPANFEEAEIAPEPAVVPIPETVDTPDSIQSKKIVLAHEVRPLARFWARIFDYLIVYAVIWLIAGLPIPEGVSTMDLVRHPELHFSEDALVHFSVVTFAAFAIWHAIEAILIHAFGATPGKALLGIRVRGIDGQRISLGKSLGRSYYVWLAGFGLGVFPIQILAMTLGFFRLLSTGLTLWDKHLRLYIRHSPMGPARILLAAAAFILLMALQQIVFS